MQRNAPRIRTFIVKLKPKDREWVGDLTAGVAAEMARYDTGGVNVEVRKSGKNQMTYVTKGGRKPRVTAGRWDSFGYIVTSITEKK
jgi:hypothetical protein